MFTLISSSFFHVVGNSWQGNTAKCEIILILSHNVCSNGKLGVWILEVRSQLHKLLLISSRQSSPSLLYLHWPIMKQIHKVHKDDSQKSNACYNIAISIVFRLLTCRTKKEKANYFREAYKLEKQRKCSL